MFAGGPAAVEVVADDEAADDVEPADEVPAEELLLELLLLEPHPATIATAARLITISDDAL